MRHPSSARRPRATAPPGPSSGPRRPRCAPRAQRLPRPDQHDQALAARDRRVEQVALQHHVVLRVDGDDHRRVLRALRLVDGRGVRQVSVSSSSRPYSTVAVVEADRQRLRLGVDALDDAAVAVPHLLVVVVAHLHHLVADAQAARAALDAVARRWSAPPAAAGSGCRRPARPGASATAPGSRAEPGRSGAAGASSPDRGSAPPRAPGRPPPGRRSRASGAGRAQLGQLAVVDAVGVDDDQALGRLAEDLGQPHDRHGAAGDHVAPAPSPARPTAADRRRPPAPGASTAAAPPTRSARQPHVEHRRLVDDQRRRPPAGARRCGAKLALGGAPFEQAVQRRRRRAGRLGRAAWRRGPVGAASATATPFLAEDRHDAAHDRGLADARAAGDHRDLGRRAPASPPRPAGAPARCPPRCSYQASARVLVDRQLAARGAASSLRSPAASAASAR